MSQFVATTVDGISIGAVYALVGLGLVLAFRATETFNFAHGQMMLLGAYLVGHWQSRHGGPFVVQATVSLVVVGLLGTAMYFLVLRRITGSHFMPLVATLGIAAVLDGAMALAFGSRDHIVAIPGLPAGVVEVAGARLSTSSLVLTGTSLALAGLVAGTLRYTQLGVRVRTAGQDPLLASQVGVRVGSLHAASWMCAAALAGFAGIVYGANNVANPSMVHAALLAFPAIVLGGLDSIEGAVAGGLIIGSVQAFTASYISGGLTEVTTYTVLLIVLLAFPRGLLGTRLARTV